MPEPLTPTVAESPRQITIEDVHRTLGAMFLELDLLRRENALLKQQLSNGTGVRPE